MTTKPFEQDRVVFYMLVSLPVNGLKILIARGLELAFRIGLTCSKQELIGRELPSWLGIPTLSPTVRMGQLQPKLRLTAGFRVCPG